MDPSAPALLDQVTSRDLDRAATARSGSPASPVGVAPWRRPRPTDAGRPRLARRIGSVVARGALLGLAVATVGGLAATSVRAVSDSNGVSLVDVARLALLAIVAASILGQGRGIFPRRRRPSVTATPESAPLILDRLDDETLIAGAPADLGTIGLPSVLLHHTQRRLDTILWAMIAIATLVLLGSIVIGLAVGLVSALQAPSVDLSTGVLAGGLALLAVGWVLVARALLGAILDRRRRRRRSALMRLLRYLLQLFRDATLGARPLLAAPSLAGVAVMILAAAIVAGVAFDPGLASGSGPGAVGPSPSSSQALSGGTLAPPTGSAPPLHLPTLGPSGTATLSPSPGASASTMPSAGATPGGPPPPSAGPTATAPPATLPPKPSPTPPKPTLAPTPVPSPTIDPDLDTDGDKVPDVIEIQYGSKPYDPLSTPEHKGFDLVFKKNTCGDTVDNDLDGTTDVKDKGCL